MICIRQRYFFVDMGHTLFVINIVDIRSVSVKLAYLVTLGLPREYLKKFENFFGSWMVNQKESTLITQDDHCITPQYGSKNILGDTQRDKLQ